MSLSPSHPLHRRQSFSPSCPRGGTWFACTTGPTFVGCCKNSNACTNGCPFGALAPATFDKAYYSDFQDQECPGGSQWYTCAGTNPPFLGCCKSNACGNETGCPQEDLDAGFLSSNPKVAEDFLPSSSAAATSTSPASATITPIAGYSSHANVGAIAGGAAGGFAALALLAVVLIFYLRRRTAFRSKHDQSSEAPGLSDKEAPAEMYPASKGAQTLHSPYKDTLAKGSVPSTPAPPYAWTELEAPNSPASMGANHAFEVPSAGHSPASSAVPSPRQPFLTP